MAPRRLLLLVLVAAAGLAAARPLEPPAPEEPWITLRVDELTLISSVSAEETAAIARDLVRMRHAIGEVTSLKVRSPKATRIFIFSSERAFAPYREAIARQTNKAIRGAFTASDGGNFIVMIRGRSEETDRTVYHELTHYFLRNTSSNLPLWLSEGMAEYYSTFRTAGAAVLIGRPVPTHVRRMRRPFLVPLRELFATTAESPLYNEGGRQNAFYAQSWALVHYLMADENRRAQLGRFLRELSAGKVADAAFAEAFGKTDLQFEAALRAYTRQRIFTFMRHKLAATGLPEVPEPEPMLRDALLFELGHLLVHAAPGAADEARRFLDEALAVNPSLAAAHADIGRLHHLAGRAADAAASFSRAAELGSADPLVHLLIGVNTLEQIQRSRRVGPPDETILRARDAFRRAAELDPGSVPAWTGIGASFVSTDEEPREGIGALEQALTLAPGDANAAFYLVQLYARTGRRAEAKRLIDDVLSRGGTKEMVDFARETVRIASVNANIRAVNEAIAKGNAGNTTEAVALLDALIPQIEDAEILGKAKTVRANFAGTIRKQDP